MFDRTGWMLIKKDEGKIYEKEIDGVVFRVPRHEVYTRKGKILLFREPFKPYNPEYLNIRIRYDKNLMCWDNK